MPRVSISHPNEIHVDVASPYNSRFIVAAKDLGGVFKKDLSVWRFKRVLEDKIKEILSSVYGYMDDPMDNQDVDIAVKINHRKSSAVTCPLYLGGLPIARAKGRDTGAIMHGSVALLSGDIDSTGSAKNWYVSAEAGTELLFTQVPRYIVHALDREKDIEYQVKENPAYIARETNKTPSAPNIDLEAVRERITEIEDTMQTLQKKVLSLKTLVGE